MQVAYRTAYKTIYLLLQTLKVLTLKYTLMKPRYIWWFADDIESICWTFWWVGPNSRDSNDNICMLIEFIILSIFKCLCFISKYFGDFFFFSKSLHEFLFITAFILRKEDWLICKFMIFSSRKRTYMRVFDVYRIFPLKLEALTYTRVCIVVKNWRHDKVPYFIV